MTLDEINLIIEHHLVFDIRHKESKRMIDCADFAYKMVTGEDQMELLAKYRSRESNSQMEQRIRLTNTDTPVALAAIQSTTEKLRRNRDIDKGIKHTDKTTKEKLERFVSNFQGEHSLEDYLHDHMVDKNLYIDSNTWTCIRAEYQREDDRIVGNSFEPFEVHSKDVINYETKQGEPLWLLYKSDREAKHINEKTKRQQTEQLTDYFFWSGSYIVELHRYDKFPPPKALDTDLLEEGESLYSIDTANGSKMNFVRRDIMPYGRDKTGPAPIIHNGVFRDLTTDGQTFVPIHHNAKNALKDTVRDKTYLDVTKAAHVFLQKFNYGQTCTYEEPETGRACEGGYMTDISGLPRESWDEHKCRKCGGSGWNYHTTEASIITLKMPEDTKDMFNLEQMAAYIRLPHETITYLTEEVAKNKVRVFVAVFNSEANVTANFANTATAEVIEFEKVTDKLLKVADHLSYMWRRTVRIMASYLEKLDGLEVHHRFPRDLKIKTATALLNELKLAREAGLNYEGTARIEANITDKLYVDDQKMVSKIMARNKFMPWHTRPIEVRMSIRAGRGDEDKQAILFDYFEDIFLEIEHEQPNFYALDYPKQREIVDAKIEAIREEMETPEPEPIIIEDEPSGIIEGEE